MKNGGWNNFPAFLETILANRITPIMKGDMRPKQIISDDDVILEKSQKIFTHYGKVFREIYDLIAGNMKEPQYFEHLMMVKHFLWFLRFCEMIDWNSADDKSLFWLVVERNDDPDQSVFKILKKVNGRKPSDPIFKVLRDRLVSKSLIELSYEDFCENFIIYFSKKVNFPTVTLSIELPELEIQYLRTEIQDFTGRAIQKCY